MNTQRRIVTVVVVGLVWMATWAAIMALLVTIIGIIDPGVIDVGEGPLDVMLIVGRTGAAAGLMFGVLLLVVEHRSALADIPIPRAVLWGIAAGAAVRLLGVTDAVFSNLVVLGAVAAVVTVALARVTRRRVAKLA
jgi:hypothetical protein